MIFKLFYPFINKKIKTKTNTHFFVKTHCHTDKKIKKKKTTSTIIAKKKESSTPLILFRMTIVTL